MWQLAQYLTLITDSRRVKNWNRIQLRHCKNATRSLRREMRAIRHVCSTNVAVADCREPSGRRVQAVSVIVCRAGWHSGGESARARGMGRVRTCKLQSGYPELFRGFPQTTYTTGHDRMISSTHKVLSPICK